MASVRVGTGRGQGASTPHPPFRNGVGDPLRDPRWGFAKRLGTAFEHYASGKPHTPDSLTRISGIGIVSDMLLWLLRGWPALANLWLPCVPNIRPSRLRGTALSGPTRRVTRRGFNRRTRRGRFDVPGPPPRRSPAGMVLPPLPMVEGRAIGPVRRPPPTSLLGFVATLGLVLGKATIPRLRPMALGMKDLGP